ncbi:cysteine synthase [Halorubrum tebenquichense DSM 14210]|uniref:Cysteine synthase n=2 Tax=Halorubrum tebenquichense TaxID=119434 RepID=M0DV88_9EURY|nr:cysteine synthase [Halorubrum tebenquichense DSM 14210]
MQDHRNSEQNCTPLPPYDIDDPILSLIGDTSMVKYPDELSGDLWVKLEKENPTGSMKDRIALGMILEMRASGELSDDDLVVEASSGNTAGGVALVANRLGLDNTITTPETTSGQKMGYVEAFGSELVTCPDVDSSEPGHYRSTAERIADERDGVFLNQYHNQLNPQVHEKWTGPELWNQTEDLTHVVCPMGTGGTLSGIGKYVKEQDDSVEIIGVDAERSNISTSFYDEEPVDYDTKIEGLGKGSETPTMWFDYIDCVVSVGDDTAISWTKKAARDQGLLIGPSAGAALSVAHSIAETDEDTTVVLIACDGGEQYFDLLTDS